MYGHLIKVHQQKNVNKRWALISCNKETDIFDLHFEQSKRGGGEDRNLPKRKISKSNTRGWARVLFNCKGRWGYPINHHLLLLFHTFCYRYCVWRVYSSRNSLWLRKAQKKNGCFFCFFSSYYYTNATTRYIL